MRGVLGDHDRVSTSSLVVRQEEPFNGEAPLDRLLDEFITPLHLFFVRSHGLVPRIDPASFRLSVAGRVRRVLSLTLEDLRRRFPRRVVTATLECAGNRRRELIALRDIPRELAWDAGAIGTAEWIGAALRDVLEEAGVGADAQHVAMSGLDRVAVSGGETSFGGSIPIAKARGEEVLLAYEVNGEPLEPMHGFPLRALVPGYIGARSVKWLGEIVVQHVPSTNYFQATAYHHSPAGGTGPQISLGEINLNCVICRPRPMEARAGDRVRVEGYAIGTGARAIERVEVTADGGHSWHSAQPDVRAEPWAWRPWRLDLQSSPENTELVARAWDSTATTQPKDLATTWNIHGYVNNAWHRVPLRRRT